MQLPYIEPVFGKHAAPMDRERARADAIELATRGLRILPGWGKHRRNFYEHITYHVSEAA